MSSEDQFFCARSPLTPCDASFVSSCEGATIRVSCQGGYVAAEDCTNEAGTGRCVSNGGFVQCR